jgi:hypothetical protein
MAVSETLAGIRYVTDANGERTDVLIPLPTWEALLASWQRLIETVEDQEDRAVLEQWLARRAAGEAKTITLEESDSRTLGFPYAETKARSSRWGSRRWSPTCSTTAPYPSSAP